MKIRYARIEDLPAIVEIYNQAIALRYATGDLDPLTVEERRAWFEEHTPDRYPIWVAEAEDGCVAGWCSLSAWRNGRKALRYTVEVSYYVHESHRRRGIGRAMMKTALDEAGALGYRTVIALLLSINPATIGLLEQFGFECWGTLPGAAEIDGRECDHVFYGRRIAT